MQTAITNDRYAAPAGRSRAHGGQIAVLDRTDVRSRQANQRLGPSGHANELDVKHLWRGDVNHGTQVTCAQPMLRDISFEELGERHIDPVDLQHFADVLGKPVTYFYRTMRARRRRAKTERTILRAVASTESVPRRIADSESERSIGC
jgi:hypothetical protein